MVKNENNLRSVPSRTQEAKDGSGTHIRDSGQLSVVHC